MQSVLIKIQFMFVYALYLAMYSTKYIQFYATKKILYHFFSTLFDTLTRKLIELDERD